MISFNLLNISSANAQIGLRLYTGSPEPPFVAYTKKGVGKSILRSKLMHLALRGSCPCMFSERLYACAIPSKTHVLAHYNANNICFRLKWEI